MKNWKTSLFGLLTAAGASMVKSDNPTVSLIGQVLSIVAPALLGYFARDNSVSDRSAGAK